MKKILTVITFIIFSVTASAESVKFSQKIKWKSYTVTLKNEGPETEIWKNFSLKIKGKNRKTVYQKKLESASLQLAGIYRSGGQEFLHLSGYTGGESGCCSTEEFFFETPEGIKSISFEQLAYNVLKVTDMDKDKDEEIMTHNEKYYGISLDDSLLGGDGKCSVLSYQLYASGFANEVFPIYSKILKGKDGNYILSDVTFLENYRNALKPYLKKAENSLKASKGKIFNPGNGDMIHGFLQYWYYMKMIGRAEEAEKKIADSGIQVVFSCESGSKNYPLKDVIIKNSRKLLEDEKK